jgi:hypothetical protein
MCDNLITFAVKRDGTEIQRACGTYWAGEKHYCPDCEAELQALFPQGWRYYPGDTCKHGAYVGGVGADYMCHYCEMGYEPFQKVLLASWPINPLRNDSIATAEAIQNYLEVIYSLELEGVHDIQLETRMVDAELCLYVEVEAGTFEITP